MKEARNQKTGRRRPEDGDRNCPSYSRPSILYSLSSILCLLAFASCASRPDLKWTEDDRQRGLASWYDDHGQRTASGEIFNQDALTAAHPSVALNSMVEVTNLQNGRKITVRINDRLPPIHNGRVIDLSKAAFRMLGHLGAGLIEVELRVLEYGNNRYRKVNQSAPAGKTHLSTRKSGSHPKSAASVPPADNKANFTPPSGI